MAARAAQYSYICQPVDYSEDPNEVRVSFGAGAAHSSQTHIPLQKVFMITDCICSVKKANTSPSFIDRHR